MNKLANNEDFANHWPSCWYGPDGQAQVFNNPLEVPEGWHDSPDKFDEDGKAKKGAKSDVPFYKEAVAAGEEELQDEEAKDKEESEEELDEDPDRKSAAEIDAENGSHAIDGKLSGAEGQDLHPEMLAPIGQMEKADIIGRLNTKPDLKGKWQPNWSKERLYNFLYDNLNTAGNRL